MCCCSIVSGRCEADSAINVLRRLCVLAGGEESGGGLTSLLWRGLCGLLDLLREGRGRGAVCFPATAANVVRDDIRKVSSR